MADDPTTKLVSLTVEGVLVEHDDWRTVITPEDRLGRDDTYAAICVCGEDLTAGEGGLVDDPADAYRAHVAAEVAKALADHAEVREVVERELRTPLAEKIAGARSRSWATPEGERR